MTKKIDIIEEENAKKITDRQRRALHLYFQQVAEVLNDAGLDMREVLRPEVDIPWSKTTVKEFLWRPIQRLQLKKESSEDLSRGEINIVFKTVNRHLAKHGVTQAFPSIESIMEELRRKEDKKQMAKYGK